MIRLNDMFSEWATGGGIFTALQSMDIPWKTESISDQLDLEYHGNWSGDKIISPLLEKYVEGDTITSEESAVIAGVVFNMFSPYWVKQWATLSAEYNPLNNYDMVEEYEEDNSMTYGKSHTRTDNLAHSETIGNTRTDNLTETDSPGQISFEQDYVYGFNSATSEPSAEKRVTMSGSGTVTNTGTQTDSGSRSGSNTGTVTDADTGKDQGEKDYTLERHGNIGIMSSQDLIRLEHDLWKWNFFMDVVFPDLDKILTLQVY